jgi:Flp pilus assembly protein TadD
MSKRLSPSLWSVIAICTLFSATALAQATNTSATVSPELRARYDAAFQASLDKPADPEVLVKFAEVAVEYGDLEGAISALERLLLISADQPEVKLELGVLYFRLGSHEAANSYLEAARTSASASDEVKQRAAEFLKQSADARRK